MSKLFGFIFSAVMLLACKDAGTGKKSSPGNSSENTLADKSSSYIITPPPGWTKIDTILMGHRMTVLKSSGEENDDFLENVNVVTEYAGKLNLEDYYEKNLVMMKSELTGFAEGQMADRKINGINFKNLKYSHIYNGRTLEVDVYFTVNKETGYVITCTASKGNLSKWQPSFDKIIQSFSFN